MTGAGGIGPSGSPSGGYGLLGLLIADSGETRARLTVASQQEASGRVADTYAGLGAGAAVSLSLRPALQQAAAWQANIDAAGTRMQVAQTALKNISDIATSFYAQTDSLNGLNASNIDNVASNARAALAQVANLLNSRVGDIYVFAGQDSGTAPVANPDQIAQSAFVTNIGAAVQALEANGTAATTAATLAIAASNDPQVTLFSPALSQPASSLPALRTSVQSGPGQTVPTGVLASANGDVASTGSSTTGSYMRDILRGLATLAGLSSAQNDSPNRSGLVADTRTSLHDAISALNGDAGVMGDRASALSAQKTAWSDTATALTAQLSSVEEVDAAATLTSVAALQTQLQASYQLIAAMQSLTLTKYLS